MLDLSPWNTNGERAWILRPIRTGDKCNQCSLVPTGQWSPINARECLMSCVPANTDFESKVVSSSLKIPQRLLTVQVLDVTARLKRRGLNFASKNQATY